jgi:hypothetical protein
MNAESSVSSYKKTDRIRGRKPGQTEFDTNHKFMQTIGENMFNELERISNEKGIRVQTLLRAVIIPEWVQGKHLSRNPERNPREIQVAFRQKRNDVRPRNV